MRTDSPAFGGSPRVAITGASGLLGQELIGQLLAVSRAESSGRQPSVFAGLHQSRWMLPTGVVPLPLDLYRERTVRAFVEAAQADWIIHTAALTDVDRCEREPELAQELNAKATQRLCEAVSGTPTRIVYLSTDYVFKGTHGPYAEDAVPNPINVYGRTKLEGEATIRLSGDQHVIVRTASVIGPWRKTFLDGMVEMMRDNPPLRAAIDQRSNITPVDHLAKAVIEIVEHRRSGVFHIAGGEIISRYELAIRLAQLLKLSENAVKAVPYESLGRDAKRPLQGGLLARQSQLSATAPSIEESLSRWINMRS
ncbi:MAG TPA: SDR family oxidoreductase [candidate division Zixibacteria bacterium]